MLYKGYLKNWKVLTLLTQCDWFTEKENLCLYGLPNETWEVNLPAEEVPAEILEPALGINFARDESLKRIGCC